MSKYIKIAVMAMATVLVFALCACSGNSASSSSASDSSDSASASSSAATSNGTSGTASNTVNVNPGTTVENDPKAIDQASAYVPGTVEGNKYVNKTVGFAYPVIEGYENYNDGRSTTEFAIKNDQLRRMVAIAYATPEGSSDLEGFVQSCWEERQAAAKNNANVEVTLASMNLLGEERPVLVTETTYANGNKSYTAQVYFEGNHNICGVFATTGSMDEAMDLLALTEPIS